MQHKGRTMKIHVGIAAAALLLGVSMAGAQAQDVAKAGGPEDSSDYLIGPGDTLNVFVWGEDDLSVTIPVRPDGMISTPLVEDMVAVGKTPTQLARDIEKVLSEYIRAPQVTIIIQNFVGTFSAQIRVLGQAVNPGSVPYRDNMTLMDVMLEVGGMTDFASGNRAKLTRTVDGKRQTTRVKLDNLMNKGDLDENVRMLPGDVITIPEAIF